MSGTPTRGPRSDETARKSLFERLTQFAASAATPRTPDTPATPSYGDPSPFGSPGFGIRRDEEILLIHLDSRYMQVGLASEATPRCYAAFSPDLETRVGDYDAISESRSIDSADTFQNWGHSHELWRMDIRGLDLGLVYDKLERALKDAIANHVLVLDGKPKRVMITLPALLPQPLLSTLLITIFELQPPTPSVTLLPNSIMSVVAAGLRSGLVIDIGWHETTVTAAYEYREVLHRQSNRGMKMLSWKMKKFLEKKMRTSGQREACPLNFEDVEDIIARLAWCPTKYSSATDQSISTTPVAIPLQNNSSAATEITLPFSGFSTPVETTFISHRDNCKGKDIHDLFLPYLAYTVLLQLSIDARNHLLQRIIITGNGSTIPGLTSRILAEISSLITTRGWNPVHNYGSASQKTATPNSPVLGPSAQQPTTRDPSAIATENAPATGAIDDSSPTHLRPQLDDSAILASLRDHTIYSLALLSPEKLLTPAPPPSPQSHETAGKLHAEIRGHHTLGPWAGASLIAGLRVAGIAQITREEFLKHGLRGSGGGVAKREQSVEVAQGSDGLGMRRAALGRRGTGDMGAARGVGTGAGTVGSTLGLWA